MLPFALKVVWFCLSSTGTIACWVIMYLFSRAIDSYWGPGLYSIFTTLLQGMFCLGMIFRMNPLQMPKSFCIVQTFVIYYSAWSLTGVCAAFTFATSSAVLWPSPVRRSPASTLAWKNKYYLPIFVFPLVCLSVSLPILLRVDAIKPTNDLHCDASEPEWGRFLGYAGLSMILTIPCLFLSAAAAHQVLRLHRSNQHSRYSFKYSTGRFRSRSQPSDDPDVTPGGLLSPAQSSDDITSTCVDPEVMDITRQPSAGTDACGVAPYNDPDVSPSSTSGAHSPIHKRSETWGVSYAIEEDEEGDRRRQIRDMMLSSMTHAAPPPKPNLVPAIWRLILFQIVFFIIQCLAALSTIIDVVRRLPRPTPFGSQHVALVLVCWGPAILLGHLPAVRRQLIFWKK